MEFMFISTRVAFGQYFMQRCVAMKTLSQVWGFLLSKDPRTSTNDVILNKINFLIFEALISKDIIDNWIDTCNRTWVNYYSDDWTCSLGLF